MLLFCSSKVKLPIFSFLFLSAPGPIKIKRKKKLLVFLHKIMGLCNDSWFLSGSCSLSWVRHVELTVDEGHGTKSTFVSFSEIQE